jgi:histidyl-tRNA synthetase
VPAPKGTYDVLPDSAFLAVREGLLAPAVTAGYAYVEPPVFEDTELFVRGVGESTDVVSKEMFTFADRATARSPCARRARRRAARALDAGLHKGQLPVKLRYAGPMFRAERPQAGRYRSSSRWASRRSAWTTRRSTRGRGARLAGLRRARPPGCGCC